MIIVLLAGYTKDSLPLGIEFVGKSFDDLRLLQVAYGYEQATKKRSRRRAHLHCRREVRLLKSRAARYGLADVQTNWMRLL
jgi:hypothetical protein